ncbi:outer membrane lipoprotein LolB [Ramlibacter sp. H39-3-26]|uniref:outer membrane lipoprotein LolB n=1 Tax=Curvibacter soli TaxID=3031331 RepID=UPI0023DBDA51|nr:outer membrane lipoprotein LolB [Ramlibacter sp. H39-3-26]
MAVLAASVLAAGCAAPARKPDADASAASNHWSGRLALQIESPEPQSFFASFDLQGDVGQGELTLYTPLGSTLAQIRWDASTATLRDEHGTHAFASVDALLQQVTGTAIPVAALFQWLAGEPATVAGWQADLRQAGEGRLVASRLAPQPAATLRLVLDQ